MMADENDDLRQCVDGICDVAKRTNGNGKAKLRTVLGLIAPLLVKSGDPRIVALGLALTAGSLAFLRSSKIKGA